MAEVLRARAATVLMAVAATLLTFSLPVRATFPASPNPAISIVPRVLPEKARFRSEIQAFVDSDRTNAPIPKSILFLGSSSIRLWKTVAADFPHHRVLNRGFGGSEIRDSVDYADLIVLPYKPRQIVFYAGANDINAGKSPDIVLHDFQEFVAKVHRILPKTRISYISIAGNPARWAQVDRVRKANQLIRDFTKTDRRLDFIDVFQEMMGADGTPKPDIFVADRLHMNERGYAIWKRVVAPHLLRPDRR